MISPEEAKKARDQHGSIRAASRATGVPKTTFIRALRKAESNEKSGQKNQARPSVSPRISTGRNRKVTNLVLPDIHAPYEDKESLQKAIEYAKANYSINHVTILGDFLDCLHVSRFSRNPRERMSFAEELDYGSELLDQLQEIFSGSKFIYIQGNHEERLRKYLLDNAPDLLGMRGTTIEEQLSLKEKGIEFVDNIQRMEEKGEPFSIGQLYYLHGSEIPGSGVNVARTKLMKVLCNIIFAHHHTIQQYTHKRFNDLIAAWSLGCLCSITPEFMPQNQHVNGLGVVTHEEDGTFLVDSRLIWRGRVF